MPYYPKGNKLAVKVYLQGFTVEELKILLQRIREIEAHDPDKLAYIELDTPHFTQKEAEELLKEIWPP